METPSGSEWRALEPQIKRLWQAQAAITGGIFFLTALAIELTLYFTQQKTVLFPGIIAIGILLLLGLPGFLLAGRRYETWRYRETDEDLAVAHGIWWKTRRYVARARIQHVDVAAGPIARALGIVSLSIHVGGQVSAAVDIPGLDPAKAEEMRKALLDLPPELPEEAPPEDLIPPPLPPDSLQPPPPPPQAHDQGLTPPEPPADA